MVYMAVDVGRTILMNENYKSRVYEITTNDANTIVIKRFRDCLRSFFFIQLLNQIKGSIEMNKYYLQDLRRSITSTSGSFIMNTKWL